MSTEEIFAEEVLFKGEQARMDKEGSVRVDRNGKDNGGQAMIGSFELPICATDQPTNKPTNQPTNQQTNQPTNYSSLQLP